MKVREFIAELLKLPQENEVRFDAIPRVQFSHFPSQAVETPVDIVEVKE